MSEPRHFFVVPPWADAASVGNLMDHGYLTCVHCQRNESGAIKVAMGLQLTAKAQRLLPSSDRLARAGHEGLAGGRELDGDERWSFFIWARGCALALSLLVFSSAERHSALSKTPRGLFMSIITRASC